MNTATFKNNGNNKYPVSTDTLDFMQEQIKLIYNITDLYGKYYILRAATTTTDGLIVWDGELMPLRAGTVQDFIALREERITVTAAGVDYANARIVRYAAYTSINEGGACVSSDVFVELKTIAQLDSELEESKRHQMPRGAIIMWSGSLSNIPSGFALCNGSNGTPNLSGRFIVGVGRLSNNSQNYVMGTFGGEETHLLTAAESGLPAHNHNFSYNSYRGSTEDGENRFGRAGSNYENHTVITQNNASRSAQIAHENRPPYYVLAYIMKII